MENRDVSTARREKKTIYVKTNISPMANAMELAYTIEEKIIFKNESQAQMYWSELVETLHTPNYEPQYTKPNPKLKREGRNVGHYKDTSQSLDESLNISAKKMTRKIQTENHTKDAKEFIDHARNHFSEPIINFDFEVMERKRKKQKAKRKAKKDKKFHKRVGRILRDFEKRPEKFTLRMFMDNIKKALDRSILIDELTNIKSSIGFPYNHIHLNFYEEAMSYEWPVSEFVEFDTKDNKISYVNENDKTEIGEFMSAVKRPDGSIHWTLKKL